MAKKEIHPGAVITLSRIDKLSDDELHQIENWARRTINTIRKHRKLWAYNARLRWYQNHHND